VAAEEIVLEPIGVVRSRLTDPADAPKQGWEGAPATTIVLREDVLDGLQGIAAGDKLLVLTWLHRAARDVLVVHPRDDAARPLQGVFVTRSPARPNPIGVHRVRVISIEGTDLRVRDLEAIDGTPVLDIKVALAL
jgi:tRNA-Thr(GGU) m(6)t(6)A37 methyltransferase TsaA